MAEHQPETTLDISLIIACYNEEPYLEDHVNQVMRTLDSCRYSYEMIFIDDHSSDSTTGIIQRICESNPDCHGIFHALNVGRGGTVAEGIRLAKGTVVGFVDIDLEVHCRYIPSMVQAILSDGYDIATAHRIYKVDLTPPGLLRWILSVGYRRLIRFILKSDFSDTETGFKFFNRELILPVIDRCQDNRWFWDTEIMLESAKAGLKVIEIPALFQRRRDIKSSLRIIPDTLDYIHAIRKYRKRSR